MAEHTLMNGSYAYGTIHFKIGHADLTTAGTTQSIVIAGFPANAVPLQCFVNIGEFFTGGTATACTLQVGDADTDGLVAALNCFAVTATGDWTVGVDGVEAEFGGTGAVLEAAYAPAILFTSTTDDVDQLDTGLMHGVLHYRRRVFPA